MYAKPTIQAIDHQTEIAGCHPCDGSLAARIFVTAGLGGVYSELFGRPCPAPPLLGPLTVCVQGIRSDVSTLCVYVEPPTPGALPGQDIITLP